MPISTNSGRRKSSPLSPATPTSRSRRTRVDDESSKKQQPYHQQQQQQQQFKQQYTPHHGCGHPSTCPPCARDWYRHTHQALEANDRATQSVRKLQLEADRCAILSNQLVATQTQEIQSWEQIRNHEAQRRDGDLLEVNLRGTIKDQERAIREFQEEIGACKENMDRSRQELATLQGDHARVTQEAYNRGRSDERTSSPPQTQQQADAQHPLAEIQHKFDANLASAKKNAIEQLKAQFDTEVQTAAKAMFEAEITVKANEWSQKWDAAKGALMHRINELEHMMPAREQEWLQKWDVAEDAWKKRVNELETLVVSLRTEISAARHANEQLNSANHDLSVTNANLHTIVTNLQLQNSSQSRETETYESAYLAGAAQATTDATNLATQANEAWHTRLAEAKEVNTNLAHTVSGLEQNVTALQQDREIAGRSIADLDGQITALTDKNAALERTRTVDRATMTTINESLDRKTQECADLTSTLSHARHENNTLASKLNALQSNESSLLSQLSEANHKLSEAYQRIQRQDWEGCALVGRVWDLEVDLNSRGAVNGGSERLSDGDGDGGWESQGNERGSNNSGERRSHVSDRRRHDGAHGLDNHYEDARRGIQEMSLSPRPCRPLRPSPSPSRLPLHSHSRSPSHSSSRRPQVACWTGECDERLTSEREERLQRQIVELEAQLSQQRRAMDEMMGMGVCMDNGVGDVGELGNGNGGRNGAVGGGGKGMDRLEERTRVLRVLEGRVGDASSSVGGGR